MPSHGSRRRFLQSSSVAAAMGLGWLPLRSGLFDSESTGHLLAADRKDKPVAKTDIPIVDPHQHLWDLQKFNLPWTKGNEKLGRSFVMSDYLAATKNVNVVKSVYMEVDVHPSQQSLEADYVIDLCQKPGNPMVGAVISGRPGAPEFKDYATKYAASKYIKGIRQVLHVDTTPQGFCLAKPFVSSIQLLGDLGLSFDLCMRSGELLDADKLVAQCPKTRFVLDHCGNMSVTDADPQHRQAWEAGMKALAQRENVICKVSGIIASAKPDWKAADLEPNICFTLETFGKERTMFAGDWPVCTLTASFEEWVDALKWIVRDMSPADQRRLFHDNAVKFYGLKDKPA